MLLLVSLITTSFFIREVPLKVAPHRALEIPDRNATYIKNQVLVSLKCRGENLDKIKKGFNAVVIYKGKYANFEVWEVNGDSKKIADSLKKCKEIYWAEPHYIKKITWTPNDPYFPFQWNLDELHCNLPRAWDIVQGGSPDVKIGILDTGIAFEYYQIPEYELDEVISSDGFYHPAPDLMGTHILQGYDAVHQDYHPNDQNGHGTHVAGTIAETTNNGYGVAGISFNSTLVPIQCGDYTGTLLEAWIIDGIGYAVNEGIKILNMSFGGPDSSHLEHIALGEAYESGVILVASTGNTGGSDLLYPAGFPEVISVGATDWADSIAYYSTYGDGIDLVAPGGDLFEDLNNDSNPDGILQETYLYPQIGGRRAHVDSFTLYFSQGTSMAAPHVSATALLLVSLGVTDPQSVRSILRETALDLGPPGYDIYYGYGRLRVDEALYYVTGGLLDTIPPSFEIWILQNPYLTKFIDIWVVSNKTLYNSDSPPESLWVIEEADTTFLTLQKVVYRTYTAQFELKMPGEILIRVMGRDFGGNWGFGERTFNAFYISGETTVLSQDGLLEIYFPSGNEDFWFTLMSLDTLPGIENPGETPLYLMGPWGRSLKSPLLFAVYTDIPHPTLLLREDSLWKEKTLALHGNRYETFLNTLGPVTIRRGKPPENLSLTLLPTIIRESTVLEFSISRDSDVTVYFYTTAGRVVKRINIGLLRKGTYRHYLSFKFPSGVYITTLTSSSGKVSKKLVVVR